LKPIEIEMHPLKSKVMTAAGHAGFTGAVIINGSTYIIKSISNRNFMDMVNSKIPMKYYRENIEKYYHIYKINNQEPQK